MRKTVLIWLLAFGSVSAFAQTSTSSIAYTTRDRGGFVVETAGGTGALLVGYGRVQPTTSTTPAGVAIFGLRQNGVLVSEAGVPGLFTMINGRTYVEVNGPTNTGLAFVNATVAPITVTFTFTDQNGNNFVPSPNSFTLAANSQITKFVTEFPFSVNGRFSGTMTFNASAPVGVIAIRSLANERFEFLMTTQPVIPLPDSLSASPFTIAHFAFGGGWKTSVLLVNSTDADISGSMQFFNEGTPSVPGQPITLSVNGVAANTFNYTVRGRSSATLETTPPANAVLQVGSVRVTPASGSNSPVGFAVFSQSVNGVTVSQASVQVQPPGNAFRTYVEVSSNVAQPGQIQSAIAIANSSAAAATVNLELISLDGTPTSLSNSILVPASGHVSKFLLELFPAVSIPFRGLLRLSSGSPVSIVSERTRYNERLDLLITTVPVASETSQSNTADLFFPVLADGGGYSTQFVLFSGISGQSTTGNLLFFGPNGQPLNVSIK